MAQTASCFPSVRARLLKEIADTAPHADGVERLLELASQASPDKRVLMEHSIDVILRSREVVFQAKSNEPWAATRLETAKAAMQRLRSMTKGGDSE
jgi:hypothetical protein